MKTQSSAEDECLNAGWHLTRRVDLAKPLPPPILDVTNRCQRCGRALRYVDLLEDQEGVRLAVGRLCSRRLRG
jgi:hypothetical protein